MLTNIILLNKFSLHWLWIDPNPTHLHKHKLSQIVELLFQSCNRYFLQSPQYRKLNCIRFTHNSISQDYKIQTKEIFLIFFLKSGKHVGSIDLPNLNSISLKKRIYKMNFLNCYSKERVEGNKLVDCYNLSRISLEHHISTQTHWAALRTVKYPKNCSAESC